MSIHFMAYPPAYETEEERDSVILNSETICSKCNQGTSLTKCVLIGIQVYCPECAKTIKEVDSGTNSER